MVGQTVKSVLTFHNFIIEELEFRRSEMYKDEESELNFAFNSEIFESTDKNNYKVTLNTYIDDGENKNLYIHIKMSGYFSFKSDEKIETEVKDNLVKKNTLSILFPYLRSYITTLTAQSSIKPIILPPLNINALVEEMDKDKKEA